MLIDDDELDPSRFSIEQTHIASTYYSNDGLYDVVGPVQGLPKSLITRRFRESAVVVVEALNGGWRPAETSRTGQQDLTKAAWIWLQHNQPELAAQIRARARAAGSQLYEWAWGN